MNSLVSFDWLKEYVDLKGVTPEEFAARMSLSGPAVEKIYPGGIVGAIHELPLHEKIVVGHVIEVTPHPNADKLRIAIVDVGRANHATTQPRNHGPVSIVCGGTNLAKGQWVAVALVGAKVRWHGEGEPIALEPIAIRGVKSEGMICAANEIGLFDAFPHAEREILDLGAAFPEMKLKPGTPLADALGLSDDVVMDIEVTSNRVDAMGMVGLAREAAAILKRKFHNVSFPRRRESRRKEARLDARLSGHDRSGDVGDRAVAVKVSAKKLCPRYLAAKIEGVTVAPSPWWLKRRLLSAGLRPINNIVDISNYVLLELAQPIHTFDAAAVGGGIDVRLARAGEKIKALDGKDYTLDDSILVIADAQKPIAIAGVMGGERSGVAPHTKDVVIEVATFDPVTIRRGARKLNLQSDAQARFERGLSTESCDVAMARAIELITEMAGGRLAGPVTDVRQSKYSPLTFSITTDEVNALIGIDLAQKEMVETLRRLGFTVGTSGKKITATVPWWRDHDIESSHDLVEEIARVYGYANIPGQVPFGLAPRPIDPELVWEKNARDISKGAGLTEVYSYSFVSTDLLAKAEYDASKMLRVQNPLSADFEVMRTTLLPSLLLVAAENQERFAEQRLFEVANVYYPRTKPVTPVPGSVMPAKAGIQSEDKLRSGAQLDSRLRGNDKQWTTLPDEQLELGALFLGMDDAWRVAKGYVEHLLIEMGMTEISWRRLANDSFWHPGRTVQAFVKGDLVATVGELSPKIARNFKLEKRVALVDLPLEKVIPLATASKSYAPLPMFPEAKRDIAVIVDHRTEFDDLARAATRAGTLSDPSTSLGVTWFDTYRGKNLPEGKKSVAMHFTFSSPERTLESAEVEGLMEEISLALKEKFQAEVRG